MHCRCAAHWQERCRWTPRDRCALYGYAAQPRRSELSFAQQWRIQVTWTFASLTALRARLFSLPRLANRTALGAGATGLPCFFQSRRLWLQ